jgi:hypothetical protein
VDGHPILQLAFISGTLTVRGESRVSIGDGVSQYGRPYEFTAAEGIVVARHELVSVTVLSEADLRALDLGGLPLLVDGDQSWRAARPDGSRGHA